MNASLRDARAGFVIVLLAAVFTFGLIRAFSIRFATGDVYPDYSSMKASPSGAKLLYDALARTPGLGVSRNFQPLEYSDEKNAAYFFLAFHAGPDAGASQSPLDTWERLANRGNRVVATSNWDGEGEPPQAEQIARRWQVKLAFDKERKLPYFSEAPGWRVMDRAGDEIQAVEKNFGKGSIVLFSESGDFSNEQVAQLDRLDRISAAIGPKTHVIFDEQHFGINESGTVVGLARHFHLTGMAVGLALCAALFIWKNAASFPPPAPAAPRQTLAGRTSISGLNTLLRRHIKPAGLAAACWNEWLAGNGRDLSPERRARAEAILRQHGRDPLAAAREIQTVLHAKGPL
ncbi:MAG TPA: hypothetical protein VMB03_16495 [Bryobacteraceae bacterium]|nr:hypothetical protein [Bryobacteraceae bacterium]